MTHILVLCLFGNAFTAFGFAFYYQAILITRLLSVSDVGVGVGNSNSFQANFMRFLNGQLFPDLLPKWSRSIMWVAASFIVLFVAALFLES